jgi:hypothetical protein
VSERGVERIIENTLSKDEAIAPRKSAMVIEEPFEQLKNHT